MRGSVILLGGDPGIGKSTLLMQASAAISLVLYIFLSNFRASLAVVVVIPLALLSTFMGLKIMGVPANLLSLGAMDFGCTSRLSMPAAKSRSSRRAR